MKMKLFYQMYKLINDGLMENNYNLFFNTRVGVGENTSCFDIDIEGEPNFEKREIDFSALLKELKKKNIKKL